MKKVAIVLLLTLIISVPCYAINIIDTMLCKKVVLCFHHKVVLVNRITGKVKYILNNNQQWVLISEARQKFWQAIYNAQVESKIVCR